MTTTTVIISLIIILALVLFYFSRINAGEKFIDQNFHPKPDLTKATNWLIGPIDNEGNQSLNMPLHPIAGPDGFVIDMGRPDNQPHYVTVDYGSLTGKSRITIKGRIEGGPFFAKDGVSPASLCLYFQRQFDDWSATTVPEPGYGSGDTNQGTEYYRWFATGSALLPLVADPFEISVNLSDKWTALRAESLDSLTGMGAKMFKDAIDNAGEVGFVLGGGDGWGHGIMAAKPARIIITSFEIV